MRQMIQIIRNFEEHLEIARENFTRFWNLLKICRTSSFPRIFHKNLKIFTKSWNFQKFQLSHCRLEVVLYLLHESTLELKMKKISFNLKVCWKNVHLKNLGTERWKRQYKWNLLKFWFFSIFWDFWGLVKVNYTENWKISQ